MASRAGGCPSPRGVDTANGSDLAILRLRFPAIGLVQRYRCCAVDIYIYIFKRVNDRRERPQEIACVHSSGYLSYREAFPSGLAPCREGLLGIAERFTGRPLHLWHLMIVNFLCSTDVVHMWHPFRQDETRAIARIPRRNHRNATPAILATVRSVWSIRAG